MKKFPDHRKENPCPTCNGTGEMILCERPNWWDPSREFVSMPYSQAPCDTCWGSGTADHPWTSLEEIHRKMVLLKLLQEEAEHRDKQGTSVTPSERLEKMVHHLFLSPRLTEWDGVRDDPVRAAASILKAIDMVASE